MIRLFKLIFIIGFLLVFSHCQVDGYIGNLHGNWQLKSVDYPNGDHEVLDSIFYNFQGNIVYLQSFYRNSRGEAYGYANLDLENKYLDLNMNKGNLDPHIYKLPALNIHFFIEKLDFRHMILNNNDTIYTMKRYGW